jgi:nucleotide-binding universal stress UspA family protein
MRRILVAVDGTPVAREAARVGLELAERLGARVSLLHVLPPSLEEHAEEFEAFEQACEQYARDLLQEMRLVTGRAGPPTETRVARGEPSPAILRTADEVEADLVVLGTRDRSRVARTLLGSVADEVVRRSTRPVLVVPESAQRARAEQEQAAPDPSLMGSLA